MIEKRKCKLCGKEFTPTSTGNIYCSKKCREKRDNIRSKKRFNSLCACCGKPFHSTSTNNLCCSMDCKMRYLHKIGKFTYYKCIEEERGIASIKEWLDTEHNVKNRTILDIANDIGAPRITIKRWCNQFGVKTRNISEDNHRRYASMTQEQKNKQTDASHVAILELFKDDEWKTVQIKKVRESQNAKATKPEIAIQQCLFDYGYGYFIDQYQLGPFFIDIAFPDIKLAVEIDGEYWHSLPKVKERDNRKNYYIKKEIGWELLRIPAIPCLKQTEKVVFDIIQTIETLKNDMASN